MREKYVIANETSLEVTIKRDSSIMKNENMSFTNAREIEKYAKLVSSHSHNMLYTDELQRRLRERVAADNGSSRRKKAAAAAAHTTELYVDEAPEWMLIRCIRCGGTAEDGVAKHSRRAARPMTATTSNNINELCILLST